MGTSAEMLSPPPPPAATRLLEICRVTPSPPPSAQYTLPLTFFDTLWLKSPPVERIFFYKLSATSSSSPPPEFHAAVVSRLKRSLSLALSRFLPLTGTLTWPADADIPFVLHTPGDGVSLAVAESTSSDGGDFDLLSGDGPRDAALSRAYLPKLAVSGSNAAVLALQVTLFPSKGFCVGAACHHAVMDGKSSAMFLKAWAHISRCDDGDGTLTEELTPFLDRTVVKDPDGIALEDVKTWMDICGAEDDTRSLEFMPETVLNVSESNKVRATFKLSRQDIQNLKQSTMRQLESKDTCQLEIKPNNLSTFVITYAYTLVCMAKAKGLEDDNKAFFGFTADCRFRLEPPLPSNYFGNCVFGFAADLAIGDLVHEAGIATAAHKLVEVIREIDKGVPKDAKGRLGRMFRMLATSLEGGLIGVGVAGSTRLGVYGVDFGYGRPEKVEITSIDRTLGMSMAESGDGSGGVEVGVAMETQEMADFTSAFIDGLNKVA